MFDLLSKLKPRVQVNRQPKGGLVSVRWFMVNFDYVSGREGFKFIQFGKGKIKWLMFLPKDVKSPLFLSGLGWKTSFKVKTVRLGTTTKPLNFMKMWRIEDVAGNKQKDWGRVGVQQRNESLRLGVGERVRDVRGIKASRPTTRDVPVHDGSVCELRCTCASGEHSSGSRVVDVLHS